jgi:Domain of unknown function (DUF4365)
VKATPEGITERRGLGIVRTAFEEIGFAFREQGVDFGIDAIVEQLENNEATGRLVSVQIKSGRSYVDKRSPDGSISFPFDDDHDKYWSENVLPVVVCLCDVDTREVYWQSVDDETIVSTGKGRKLLVPMGQKVDSHNRSALVDIATPLVPKERYTVIGPEDISHGLAKRYTFRVIVNGTASRAELAAVVRQVIAQGAKRTYNRNDIAAQRWLNTEAHIVCVFVALSAAENERSNYVCRAQWISEDVPEGGHPGAWGGKNIGNGVYLIWNENHDVVSKLYSDSTLSKEDYLAYVAPMLDQVGSFLEQLGHELSRVRTGVLEESEFVHLNLAQLDQLSDHLTTHWSQGSAPFECSELDRQIDCLLIDGSNLKLYFTEESFMGGSKDSRMWLAKSSLEGAMKSLANAQYELGKIR